MVRRRNDNPGKVAGGVGLKLLRPIDAQFALTVAGNDDPAVTLAAAAVVMTQVKVTCDAPLSRLTLTEEGASLTGRTDKRNGYMINWGKSGLLASAAVAAAIAPAPLILCGDRLYLNRMCGATSVRFARFLTKLTEAHRRR